MNDKYMNDKSHIELNGYLTIRHVFSAVNIEREIK